MKQIERLIQRAAQKKETLSNNLDFDNPYMGMSSEALLDYLDGDNYKAPEMGTLEWSKYMLALMAASSDGSRELE